MALFRRQGTRQAALPLRRLPDAMIRFGRFEYYKNASGENASDIYRDIIAPMYEAASADPAVFVESLRHQTAGEGGWAAYGAAHLVWEVLSSDQLAQLTDDSSYKAIAHASLEFLRASGAPPKMLTGYEWKHWIASGGTIDTWIPPRQLPSREAATISALRDGEVRPVARVSEEPDANVILVCRNPDGKYAALIDARQSDEDPQRSQSQWKLADDLYGLYADIGASLQTPPPWHDQDLEPFFPLPAPAI
jgi:hypothetical protein